MNNSQYQKDKRITIHGGEQEVATAEGWLDKILPLPPGEGEARLLIQQLVDEHKLQAHISFENNGVWSYDRVVRDFKRFLQDPRDKDGYAQIGSTLRVPVSGGKCPMTDQLYHFFSLNCGTIAHYDKHGWHATYPDVPALRELFRRNEYGQSVVEHVPAWKTDVKRIVVEMERLLAEADPERFVQQVQAVIGSK